MTETMFTSGNTRFPIWFLIGWLTLLPHPLLADVWYEHYGAAEKALSNENWGDAIEEINSALEKKGDSGARVRTYGMKFVAYFPYLKLGIAYYHLGRLEAAHQALETEEHLGAIAQSEKHSKELGRYRELIHQAQQIEQQMAAERVAGIVANGLSESARLEKEGRIEDAIAALGNALAVDPENSAAVTVLTRLRAELAREQDLEELKTRVALLISTAKQDLEAGYYSKASSSLRQALSLADDPEAQSLLDEAQKRLKAELEMETEDRSRSIDRGLTAAAELEAAGRLDEALGRLQSVLALDPSNPVALSLQERVIDARIVAAETERQGLRADRIDGLIDEAEAAVSAGGFEDALGTANLVLSLDGGNAKALDLVARAYRGISQSLLGGSERQNFPPAIRFVDQREEQTDGTLAQTVASPDFLLSGVVIDDSPVELEFFDAGGHSLEGSSQSQPVGDLFITEFRLTHSLPAGASRLRLVATDSENVASSSEYSIVYQRPFIRSPWFLALLGSLLVLALGTSWQRRNRRRAQLRRRRFNPYVAGAPVLDEGLFFGRQQLLDRILQTLHNNSLLLHGERRIGKTTLQHQLKRRLEALDDPNYEFYSVFVDLQGTPEELFFATLAEEVFQELSPHLDGIEPSSEPTENYVYRDLVRDLRRILKVLNKKSEKKIRLVLLIDEVDELNSYDPRVNQKLRSLFMKSFAEDLVAVVSGVSIKKEWEREGSPWYNFFEEINVGPFRETDARALIEDPIRGLFQLEDGCVERIIDLTDGRPYLIQAICMKLVNRMYEVDRRAISLVDVEAVANPAAEDLS